jgi:hypothetical protein
VYCAQALSTLGHELAAEAADAYNNNSSRPNTTIWVLGISITRTPILEAG